MIGLTGLKGAPEFSLSPPLYLPKFTFIYNLTTYANINMSAWVSTQILILAIA